MSLKQNYDYLFRVFLIGDSGVGKTSLISRFCEQIFTESRLLTLGTDFKIKTFDLSGKTIKLQVWDIPAQAFTARDETLYWPPSKVCGAIFVYDITDRESFTSIRYWWSQIEKYTENHVKLLVGNKSDLEEQRQVPYEKGKAYADKLDIKFLEVSAKSDMNVNNAFFTIANEIKQRIKPEKKIELKKEDTISFWRRLVGGKPKGIQEDQGTKMNKRSDQEKQQITNKLERDPKIKGLDDEKSKEYEKKLACLQMKEENYRKERDSFARFVSDEKNRLKQIEEELENRNKRLAQEKMRLGIEETKLQERFEELEMQKEETLQTQKEYKEKLTSLKMKENDYQEEKESFERFAFDQKNELKQMEEELESGNKKLAQEWEKLDFEKAKLQEMRKELEMQKEGTLQAQKNYEQELKNLENMKRNTEANLNQKNIDPLEKEIQRELEDSFNVIREGEAHICIEVKDGKEIKEEIVKLFLQRLVQGKKIECLTLNLFEWRSETVNGRLRNITSQVAKTMENLVEFHLKASTSWISYINDATIEELSIQIGSMLSKLKKLSLDFSCCVGSRITDKGIQAISTKLIGGLHTLGNLALNFTYSTKITDKSLIELADQIGSNLSDLEQLTLVFSDCSNITEKTPKELGNQILLYLSKLQSLSLNFKRTKITQRQIDTLSKFWRDVPNKNIEV